jgi:serine phosphatase RsbU (regulator of sigma subunit)
MSFAVAPATRGLARRVLAWLLGLDLVFKVIIALAIMQSFGVDGEGDRLRAALLNAGLALPLVMTWVLWLGRQLRRIERGAGADADGLSEAATLVYRLPLRGACAWALHWVLLSGLTLVLLDRRWPVETHMAPLTWGGLVLFELTMIGGALSLAFSLLAWLLGPAAGALSLEARRLGRAVATPGISIRQQLVGMAFALSMTPMFWMGVMAYTAHLRTASAAAAGEPGGFFFTFSIYLLGVAIWGPLCAWFLGHAVAAPVDRVAAALDAVARAGRGEEMPRVPVFQRDEVGQLAEHANAMIDVLEATGRDLERAMKDLQVRERLQRELEIAARIQTSILPRKLALGGAEISARMVTATEVGGDYFDLLPAADGGWLAIGEVSGHGLPAGMIMMMAQSAVAALVERAPRATPAELLVALNAVLFENIRQRMGDDEYLTLSLLRYHEDGRVFAGHHEDLLVCRAATGRCQPVPTQGAWMGVMREVGHGLADERLLLEPGDLLVLSTDGITEARDAEGRQFGGQRLSGLVERLRARPVEEIVDGIFSEARRWRPEPEDDQTLLTVRYLGSRPAADA